MLTSSCQLPNESIFVQQRHLHHPNAVATAAAEVNLNVIDSNYLKKQQPQQQQQQPAAMVTFEETFDRFIHANSSKSICKSFQEMCDLLKIDRKQIFEKGAVPLANIKSGNSSSGSRFISHSNQQYQHYSNAKPTRLVYQIIKSRTDFWKANELWKKYDKRANLKDYSAASSKTMNMMMKCSGKVNTSGSSSGGGGGASVRELEVLIIGCGPVGLRLAIECAFLGLKVSVVEKRDRFSRNNVLHLWPYTIIDLKNLGAKQFYGKFCAGSIDHISIRKLQCILLKVALLVGVQVHFNTSFEDIIEPPPSSSISDAEKAAENDLQEADADRGWRVHVLPESHPIASRNFDVIIGADGRRNSLPGFNRKEFRGRLAIGITANFVNYNTAEEAEVEERSGVAFIFDQKFFLDLRHDTGIDLENIVYYKDDTHYFVMTAKKQSLIDKGVIKQDMPDANQLLSKENVNFDALCDYAKEAAYVSTNRKLCRLDFAKNHYGQADVAMFDFTSLFQSENASRIVERRGKRLLMSLVGDSLLEPFWPLGTGIARGFLAAFDTAWQIKGFASNKNPLDLLCERESIYQLLSQTTHDNMSKNYQDYTIDPTSRYTNLNFKMFQENQIRHLYDNSDEPLLKRPSLAITASGSSSSSGSTCCFDNNHSLSLDSSRYNQHSNTKKLKTDYVQSHTLLHWCQMVVQPYGIQIENFTSSWRSGLAFGAIIHRFRPDLIDYHSLSEKQALENYIRLFETMRTKLNLDIEAIPEEFVYSEAPNKFTVLIILDKLYGLFKNNELIDVSLNMSSSMANDDEITLVNAAAAPSTSSDHYHSSARRLQQKKSSKHGSSSDRIMRQQLQQQRAGDKQLDSKSNRRALNVNVNVNNITNLFESKIENKMSTSSTTTIGNAMSNSGSSSSGAGSRIYPSASSSALLNSWAHHNHSTNRNQPQQHHSKAETAADEIESLEFHSDSSSSSSSTSSKSSSLSSSNSYNKKSSNYHHYHHQNNTNTTSMSSTLCYVCNKKVYLMERQTVMDLFMHNNCFKCNYCSRALRKGFYSYLKDPNTSKYVFYCTNHLGMIPATNNVAQQRQRKKLQAVNLLNLKRSAKFSIDKSLGLYEKINDQQQQQQKQQQEEELATNSKDYSMRNRVEIVDKRAELVDNLINSSSSSSSSSSSNEPDDSNSPYTRKSAANALMTERAELEFEKPTAAGNKKDSSGEQDDSASSPTVSAPSSESLFAYLSGLSSSKLDRSFAKDNCSNVNNNSNQKNTSSTNSLISSDLDLKPKSKLKRFNAASYTSGTTAFDDRNLDRPTINNKNTPSFPNGGDCGGGDLACCHNDMAAFSNRLGSANRLKRSTLCNVCKKNTYITDRIRVQGLTFHRECIKCSTCGILLDNKEEFSNRMINNQIRFFCVNHLSSNYLNEEQFTGNSSDSKKSTTTEANIITSPSKHSSFTTVYPRYQFTFNKKFDDLDLDKLNSFDDDKKKETNKTINSSSSSSANSIAAAFKCDSKLKIISNDLNIASTLLTKKCYDTAGAQCKTDPPASSRLLTSMKQSNSDYLMSKSATATSSSTATAPTPNHRMCLIDETPKFTHRDIVIKNSTTLNDILESKIFKKAKSQSPDDGEDVDQMMLKHFGENDESADSKPSLSIFDNASTSSSRSTTKSTTTNSADTAISAEETSPTSRVDIEKNCLIDCNTIRKRALEKARLKSDEELGLKETNKFIRPIRIIQRKDLNDCDSPDSIDEKNPYESKTETDDSDGSSHQQHANNNKNNRSNDTVDYARSCISNSKPANKVEESPAPLANFDEENESDEVEIIADDDEDEGEDVDVDDDNDVEEIEIEEEEDDEELDVDGDDDYDDDEDEDDDEHQQDNDDDSLIEVAQKNQMILDKDRRSAEKSTVSGFLKNSQSYQPPTFVPIDSGYRSGKYGTSGNQKNINNSSEQTPKSRTEQLVNSYSLSWLPPASGSYLSKKLSPVPFNAGASNGNSPSHQNAGILKSLSPVKSTIETKLNQQMKKLQVDTTATENAAGTNSFNALNIAHSPRLSRNSRMAKLHSRRQLNDEKRLEKQRQDKRLRMSQEIQRKLDEIDTKLHDLEKDGVKLEKRICKLDTSSPNELETKEKYEQELYNLIHEKNLLTRIENELSIQARALALEEQLSECQQKLRETIDIPEADKSIQIMENEKKIMEKIVDLVEEKNKLVEQLESLRVLEREEDHEVNKILGKNFGLSSSDRRYQQQKSDSLEVFKDII